jgi:hypothetical protein
MSDKYYGSCEAAQVYIPGNVTESDKNNQDLFAPGSCGVQVYAPGSETKNNNQDLYTPGSVATGGH